MRLTSLVLAFALQQQDKPGSIEGTVRAGGEPQPGINITLGKQETKTDAGGRYSLRDLPAGRHNIRIGASFRSATVPVSRTISLASGQSIIADFELTLQGSISGAIVDEFDEAVSGAEVVLLGREYGAGALRYFRRHAARTNDQGEYRFDYVRPGVAYLVLVSPNVSRLEGGKSNAPADPRLRRRTNVPTFFPGVTDYAGATPIILRPGEHREGINFRSQRAPAYCVEAQLTGSDLSFQIHPRRIPYGLGPNGGTTGMPPIVKPGADGKVRVCELPPAEYRLTALEGDLNDPLSLASATVSLGDRDATNITLQPIPRLSIPIELAWAGAPPEKPAEGNLRVFLQSITRSFGSFRASDAAMAPASLEIRNVLMDDYYLRVGGLTGRLYIKEILYGNDNITYAPFRPGTQISGTTLRAVIGHDGAYIKARIRDRDGKHVSGAMVITMPAVFASEAELASALQTGSADQNGDYESTRALAPGKYYVLALTPPIAEPLQADDVTRLINLRTKALEVTLEPNSTANLNLEPGSW